MTNYQKNELQLIIERLDKLGYSQERIKEILTSVNIHLNFASPLSFIERGLSYKVYEYLDWLEINQAEEVFETR